MRAVVQRVTRGSVTVEGRITGAIDTGLLVLLGVEQGDGDADARALAEKLVKLRIFQDEAGKTNLSVRDVGGRILAVSQFTLCADLHGNRPGFSRAMAPAEASRLYDLFCDNCGELLGSQTEKGIFGADMTVDLTNEGPFTVIVEARNGEIVYHS